MGEYNKYIVNTPTLAHTLGPWHMYFRKYVCLMAYCSENKAVGELIASDDLLRVQGPLQNAWRYGHAFYSLCWP